MYLRRQLIGDLSQAVLSGGREEEIPGYCFTQLTILFSLIIKILADLNRKNLKSR